jgi:N-acetylated-alpha-linked acidic dipeptidase
MSELLLKDRYLSRTYPKNIFLSPGFLLFPLLMLSIFLISDCRKIVPEHDPASYKMAVDKHISPDNIDRYLKYFTSEPHLASSPRNNELAEFIYKEWNELGLDEVELVPYDVLLSFPEEIQIELVSPQAYKLNLREESYDEDPDTQRPDVGIPYNAYSRSGEITASLVYANSGNPQDYDLLEKKGIPLQGKVALVRYSAPYSYRGFKAYTAEKRGLSALLIYSDPAEDGHVRGAVFPDGPWGPLSHIQRGGIPYDFIYPGDPLTPGWASIPGCERIAPEESAIIPDIISVPISAQDALPLLDSIGGEEAPEAWQGALPVKYRLGSGAAKVHIRVRMRNPVSRIYNVIGTIRGTQNPDETVLVGNHRDAWVFGGHDPSSGTACLMELVRAFAQAKKEGFRPARSIVFANWDAEEFTLTGSTEWGEDNRDWLAKNLVAYINVDSSAAGKDFSVQAVPCLSSLIIKALKEVQDPSSGRSVYECWKEGPAEKGTIAIASGSGRIDPIGSGTDHAVFLNHIGAPAINMTFSGDYGVYHSMYDNFYWMSHFGDPGMHYTAALARIWNHMIVELSCNRMLYLDYETYARELKRYLGEWADRYDSPREKSRKLFLLIKELEKKASVLTPYVSGKTKVGEKITEDRIQKANRLLIQMERDFTDAEGIQERDWYKHLVFGARYTYDVLLLPALAEASEAHDESGIASSLHDLELSLERAAAKLIEIANLIDAQ